MARLILAFTLFVSICASPPAGATPAPREAEWTFLYYMNGDNNLGPECLYDLIKMCAQPGSDQVNVVVQVDLPADEAWEHKLDGIFKKVPSFKRFTTTKRLKPGPDAWTEIEDLGEQDMCARKTLSDFITWGLTNYPAKRTALALWDHGGGWYGWGGDISHKNSLLSLDDLNAAIEAGRKGAGADRFDMLIWQCCLMSTLEVMNMARRHARFMLGSEEVAYMDFATHEFLGGLARKPSMSPEEAGKLFCTSFRDRFDKSPVPALRAKGMIHTYALVDLDKVPAVISALEKVAQGLEEKMARGRAGWLLIAGAQNGVQEYGRDYHNQYHLRDLHHFVRNLKDVAEEDARAKLLKAIESAVLFHFRGADWPHSRGISIYFPPDQALHDKFLRTTGREYARASCTPKWTAFLKRYLALGSEDKEGPVVDSPKTTKTRFKRGELVNLTTRVKADDIAGGHFFLGTPTAKETYTLLGMYSVDLKRDPLDCEFDGTWLAWGNQEKSFWACALVYDEVGDPGSRDFSVIVPVSYQPPKAKKAKEILLAFRVSFDAKWKFKSGEFVTAIEGSDGGSIQIDLTEGATLKPIYYIVTEGGKKTEPSISPKSITLTEAGLRISEHPLPVGKYRLGYIVKDHAGNTTVEGLEIDLIE